MRHECMVLLREKFHLEQCIRWGKDMRGKLNSCAAVLTPSS